MRNSKFFGEAGYLCVQAARNQAASLPVRRSMKSRSLYALAAVVLIGVSCAQLPRQPPSEAVRSAPTGEPVSIRNGEFAFKGPDFTAWLVAPDGSGLRPISLPDTTAMIVPWAYSPDGMHIAYTGYERGDAGDYAIYVSNADGSDVTRSHEHVPRPDGEQPGRAGLVAGQQADCVLERQQRSFGAGRLPDERRRQGHPQDRRRWVPGVVTRRGIDRVRGCRKRGK
jgi:hypothetical protein